MRQIAKWQGSGILNKSDAGFGFDYSINPYRGCAHACRYCYARDTHRYLDLGIGEDFERRLFVKPHLAARLPGELAKIRADSVIAIGTVTDPYQALEGRNRLTRHAIDILGRAGQPFTITTKSPLILRDLDLLTPLGRRGQCHVNISLISLDATVVGRLEPGAPPPRARLKALEELNAAGVPAGLFCAPIVPLITDQYDALHALFAAARASGARWLMAAPLRLSPTLLPYFLQALQTFNPDLVSPFRDLYPDGRLVRTYRDTLAQQLSGLEAAHRLPRSLPGPTAFIRDRQPCFEF